MNVTAAMYESYRLPLRASMNQYWLVTERPCSAATLNMSSMQHSHY